MCVCKYTYAQLQIEKNERLRAEYEMQFWARAEDELISRQKMQL